MTLEDLIEAWGIADAKRAESHLAFEAARERYENAETAAWRAQKDVDARIMSMFMAQNSKRNLRAKESDNG